MVLRWVLIQIRVRRTGSIGSAAWCAETMRIVALVKQYPMIDC